MRSGHFEALAPVCPSCRAGGVEAPLEIGRAVRSEDGEILEGALVCSRRMCQAEYPIIDGVPFIVPDVRGAVAGQLAVLRARDDLSPYLESLIGDCAGPDSELERARYQASSYGRSHWGDLDPEEPGAGPGFAALAGAALELVAGDLGGGDGGDGGGIWLDLGCGPGRASFELSARTGALVLGIDLNAAMLRVAAAARRGRVAHPLRRVGLVYDRREFAVELEAADRVDFWACDVMALPLRDGVAAGALSLNVIDCVASPLAHLRELGRVLAPGAAAVLSSPYDWSTTATPLESWLGGHSQRGPQGGRSDAELRRLLAAGDPAGAATGLVLEAELDAVEWDVYVHERARVRYSVHVGRVRRVN